MTNQVWNGAPASKSTVAPRVVCRASMKDNVQKVAAAVTAAPVLLASNPAYAAYVSMRWGRWLSFSL